MTTIISDTQNQTTGTSPVPLIATVISKDGTKIGYRQYGQGPGVVIVHGAMSSSLNHTQLAEALASIFTVYVVDRRGRGLSGPYGSDYHISKDVEDLEAVLTKTEAHYALGVSSGALVLLQTMLTSSAIQKAVIFEPPLSINGSAPAGWLPRYDREIAAGKVAAALVTGMQGAQLGPPLMNRMPHRLMEFLTNRMMAGMEKTAKPGEVTWRSLASTLHYDGQIAVEMAETLGSYRAVQAQVLLLGGSQSPAYLKFAHDQLEQVLPQVQRIELAKAGHAASWNSNMGGQPQRVAEAMRQFFAR